MTSLSDSKTCKGCITPDLTRADFPIYKSGPKAGQVSSAYCKTCSNKQNNIRQTAKRKGVTMEALDTTDYKPRVYYKVPTELHDDCVRLYTVNCYGTVEIAELLGISDEAVRQILLLKGVELRSVKEAAILAKPQMMAALEKHVEATHGPKSVRLARQRVTLRRHKTGQRKKRREVARQHIAQILKRSKCTDCPESRWVVLQFDHRDPSQKAFDIAEGVAMGYSVVRLQVEIDKCDVICPTCHNLRTANMFGSWRLK